MSKAPWKNWVWKGCQKCGSTDPEQFYKKTGTKSGLTPLCKACHVPGRLVERLNKYHLTPEKYNLLLAKQGGVCAMCFKPPNGRRLSVDHDHTCCPGKKKSCGKCIRGLLHVECNALLGFAKDSVERLEQATQYLRNATTQSL